MGDVTIRRAEVKDVAALAELGRDTFVDAFAQLYPPEDLEAFLQEAYTPEAFLRYLAAPGHAIWLAEENGRPMGYAHAGPCGLPHPDATPACGELKRLYVRKEAQGRGLGGDLLQTGLAWLEAPGRVLWIGVWSQNWGAQRLYGRHGFTKVGEYLFPVGQSMDREFILRR